MNDKINELERALKELYQERRGQIINGIGYCCVCGKVEVDYHNGWDTCPECAENI